MSPKTPGIFVTSTGTDAGKTLVSRAITLALRAMQRNVVALKPLETGCQPHPADAVLLAEAAGRPELAHDSALYRAEPALSPYAVTLETGLPAPKLAQLATRVTQLATAGDFLLVEGAGGLLVPIDATHSIADFAALLGLPLCLVVPDVLGVLSHTLAAYESARSRQLPLAAVVLNQTRSESNASAATNQRILAERLPVPVLRFPHVAANADALRDAAHASGLIRCLTAATY